VQQRWPVQADQQPRLADVLTGERGQERAQPLRDRAPLLHHRGRLARFDNHHEVEIAELVHAAGEV
jgi:hypothetical protein